MLRPPTGTRSERLKIRLKPGRSPEQVVDLPHYLDLVPIHATSLIASPVLSLLRRYDRAHHLELR